MNIIYGICCAGIVLTVISLLNNMYYIIDENNFYHRQSMYWLSQVLALTGVLLNSIVIISYRKHFTRIEIFSLIIYIILPVIGIAIGMIWYGYVPVYITSTLIILFIFINMQAQQAKAAKEKELQLTQSRIAIMLSQIQPHFLYNSLTAIRELCLIDPKKAYETVDEFSTYLRGNLDSLSFKKPIPFEKELSHVKTYLSLEKKRFGDNLNIIYDINASLFLIPSLTLQPIVENAVRHGVTKREDGGTVTITTEETEAEAIITVTDDGIGFDPTLQKNMDRVGIANVRSRLSTMCDGILKISSEPGVGTTAVIIIIKE